MSNHNKPDHCDCFEAKPKWENAPEWANYLARDKDGGWNWFSHKPKPEAQWERWDYSQKGAVHAQASGIKDWKETLEKRPAKGDK